MTFSQRAVETAADAMREGIAQDDPLKAARAALTAALAVDGVALQGWQKITEENEPPRDIPLLLGWWREWPSRVWETESGLYGSTKGGWNHGQATHWQPAPQPPAASEGEERK